MPQSGSNAPVQRARERHRKVSVNCAARAPLQRVVRPLRYGRGVTQHRRFVEGDDIAVYILNFTIEPTGEVKPSCDTDPWTEENGILIFFDFRYRLSKQHALLVAIEIVETENMKWFRPSDEPDGDWLLDFDAFKSAFGEPFTSWDWLPSETNLSPSYSERSPSFTTLAFSITEPPQTVS